MLTLSGNSQSPRTGKQMNDLSIIHDGALAIRKGKIIAVGKTQDVTKHSEANMFLVQGKKFFQILSISIHN